MPPLKRLQSNPSEGRTVAPAQADSTAATVDDLKTDLNALLAKLRAAGIISS